jgi:HK97 family phage major capsid protein
MTTATAEGSAAVDRGLRRYARALGSGRAVRRALGRDVDPDYCLTDFLWRVRAKDEDGLGRVYQAERTKAPLGQTSGPSGGYLLPPDLHLDLMGDVAELALVRPRATVVPMSSASLLLPLPDATTAQSAGTSPFFGGIKMAWTNENLTRPETEPLWRLTTLRAWDLTGYALQSNPLFQDGGGGLESYLRQLFARSIGWYEDYAYLQGTGLGQPLGIINSAASALVSRQTGTSFTVQDVGGMSAALMPASWARAIWLISPSVWPKILAMSAGTWQVNQPILEGAVKPHFVINGQGGYVTEKLPALGTKGDVVLFDPLLYVLGDRGAVEIAFSDQEPTAFNKNQSVWRVTYRGDGQPWLSKTITLQDTTTAVSPYVVLV